MLTTSVERLEGTTARLTVTVPAAQVDEVISRTYGEVGAKLRIPGFRKGKAPRPVIDNFAGRDYVLAEATEALVNEVYPQAIDAEGLRPIESPDVDELETVRAGEEFTFVVEVELRPELTVGDYHDITVNVPRREVTEEEIDASLEEVRERFATLEPVEERGVEKDDFVLLSFVGYVDGETYEGNTVDKYLYEMGRGLMPEEFEAGIVGLAPGAETHVEFIIPDTSSNPEYVGKKAQFDVTIHEIKAKKLPEADDALANEIGFENIGLVRDDVRGRLDVKRLFAYNQAKEKGAREALAAVTPGDIPEAMIKSRADSLETDFKARLKDQGLTLEQYAGLTGLSREAFEAELARDAEQLVREDLALESLFRSLGYEVTDEDLDREFEELAQASQSTVEEAREKWQSMGLMAVIAEGVMHRRAVGWLMENVKTNTVEDEGDAPSEPEAGTKKAAKKSTPKKATRAEKEATEATEAETAE